METASSVRTETQRADAEHGLEVPPPPPPTRDLRHAWRLLRRMREDPTQTSLGMELVDALGGYFDDLPFQRFATSEFGKRLLREQPDLPALLADRDALASLPEDSFGRAFLRFAERNGISPSELVEMATERRAAAGGLDPLRSWFADRQTVSHDLWHVLTGYGTDPIGENAVLLFTRGQGVAGPGLRILTVFMLLRQPWSVKGFIWSAYLRGRRATPLILAPYEELLPLPIGVVRERLTLGDPLEAHPGGILAQHDAGVVRLTETH